MIHVLKRLDSLTITRTLKFDGECELSFALVEKDGAFSILMHVEQTMQDQYRYPYDVTASLGSYTIMDAIRLCTAMRFVKGNVHAKEFLFFLPDVSLSNVYGGHLTGPSRLADSMVSPHDYYHSILGAPLPDWTGDLLLEMYSRGYPTNWLYLTREVEWGHIRWDEQFQAFGVLSPDVIADMYRLSRPYANNIKWFVGAKSGWSQSNAIFLLHYGVACALQHLGRENGRDVVLGAGILFVKSWIDPRELDEPITLDQVIHFIQHWYDGVGGFRRRSWYRRNLPKLAEDVRPFQRRAD